MENNEAIRLGRVYVNKNQQISGEMSRFSVLLFIGKLILMRILFRNIFFLPLTWIVRNEKATLNFLASVKIHDMMRCY